MNDLARYRLCADLHAPASANRFYCYLLDMAGDRHNSVVVSIKSLAKSLGLSRSATSRNLNRLRRLGMIGIVPRYSEDGGRLSNQYTLN
jgi:DNA-binding IscR family transcriptional regulator